MGETLCRTFDFYLHSGMPAGTLIDGGEPWLGRVWIEGEDKHLFTIISDNDGSFSTTRPLPVDVYSVFHNSQWDVHIPCDYFNEERGDTYERFVHVSAPDSVLHEAFLDPVAEGSTVGPDSSNGVLEPASYEVEGGTTTSIDGIEWESGQVRMEFSPSAPPAGNHADFIALGGSVALRLKIEDANQSVDGDSTESIWGVCSQPWSAGDKLMLRISESGSKLLGATNDSECLSSVQ